MFSFTKTFVIAAALATSVYAQVAPTSPDGTTVAKIGSQLTTLFTKDTTGKWNNVSIDLMSGDNFHMIPVTNLATGIDGTSVTEYTFTVPDVTPTSKIYFLQFTPGTGVLSDVTWTTRFTIAGEDGSTTPPVNSTQPGSGDAIPWGVGQLVGSSSTGASPSSPSSSGDVILTSASATASASSILSSASAAVTSASSSAEAMISSASSSMAQVVSSAASAASGTSVSATRSIAAAAATSSGAAGKVEIAGMGFMGIVVGLVGLVL